MRFRLLPGEIMWYESEIYSATKYGFLIAKILKFCGLILKPNNETMNNNRIFQSKKHTKQLDNHFEAIMNGFYWRWNLSNSVGFVVFNLQFIWKTLWTLMNTHELKSKFVPQQQKFVYILNYLLKLPHNIWVLCNFICFFSQL